MTMHLIIQILRFLSRHAPNRVSILRQEWEDGMGSPPEFIVAKE